MKYNIKYNFLLRFSLKKIRVRSNQTLKLLRKISKFRRFPLSRKASFERVVKLVADKQLLLTVTAIFIQLLVHLFHPLDIDARTLAVVHHRQRVLLADDALGRVLYTERRVPGFVNVSGRKVFQHRQVASAGIRLILFETIIIYERTHLHTRNIIYELGKQRK